MHIHTYIQIYVCMRARVCLYVFMCVGIRRKVSSLMGVYRPSNSKHNNRKLYVFYKCGAKPRDYPAYVFAAGRIYIIFTLYASQPSNMKRNARPLCTLYRCVPSRRVRPK